MHTASLIITACTATLLTCKEMYFEAVLFALIFIVLSNPHEHCNHTPMGTAAVPMVVDYSLAATGAILPKDVNEANIQYGSLYHPDGSPVMTVEQQTSIENSADEAVGAAPEIKVENTGLQLLSKGLYNRQFIATPQQIVKKAVFSDLSAGGSSGDAYTRNTATARNTFYSDLLLNGQLKSREDALDPELDFLTSSVIMTD